MIDFYSRASQYSDPEQMALAYLSSVYENQEIPFPINPFELLKREGILFSINNFRALEGVYIPASSKDDIPFVGINSNRPITRQRFTAAHELCHHFRDAEQQICPIVGRKNSVENYADRFSAALLMPFSYLRDQVNIRKDGNGYISFDDGLEIADYFGTSFEACLFRIAYRIHAIDGNTEKSILKKRAKAFSPDKKRKAAGKTYLRLYEDLIDSYQEQLSFAPNEFAKNLFQEQYIYSKMITFISPIVGI